MKTLFTLLSLLLIYAASNAQNIVPNFSFEESDSCPTLYNQSTYKFSLGCIGWGQANAETTDYFNACDTATISIGRLYPWVGVPHNEQGSQTAFDGVAYTGIVIYDTLLPDDKEYLITNIPPLEVDTTYKVTIHVSLADSSRFATDGMGVLFTTYGSPDQYTSGTLEETPQIDYTSYGVISDTAHWTTLSGTFIADSAYTNLIIGCFKNASDMHILGFNGNAHKTEPYTAYYYVDAIVVEKLSATGIATINNNENKVSIYPNPFTDHAILIFDCLSNTKYSFDLFSMQAQEVERIENVTSCRIEIERNNLPAGFYYYQLRNENNIVANGK